jgi:hypothetical protein
MTGIDHLDLVVTSLARSVPSYRVLLGPFGRRSVHEDEGERGETIHYRVAVVGLRALGLVHSQPD